MDTSFFVFKEPQRSKVRPPYPAQSITNGVGQAAIDSGKPLPGKDGLSCVEREELVRLRRLATRQDKRVSPANDLAKRQFKASDPNQLWVADMTYVSAWAGFLYLAVVIDVWSRRVVGWSMGESMTTDLVLSALNMALTQRKPQDVIHHRDQGFERSQQTRFNACKHDPSYIVR
ncbi:MAG: DDE-type integrase/transposase/recombinase [Delftia acidovorans]|uniref:DDE-type integrase/transposase/recombinase n=1 Tax=Delftia acidovorans TaxID=80866 RepID=A0A7T2S5C3_DELAC|nr:DDE-type integrase/transposase/recombinase [Delftia acidovorans]QPS09083.1 DDE-type integrase/transposase/recombinase [Delftia acidovorans]